MVRFSGTQEFKEHATEGQSFFSPEEGGFNQGNRLTLSATVQNVKELAIRELETLLNAMLNTADDHLFDMADRSNQVTFFDSMRLLRIKRKGFVNRFKQEIESAFLSQLALDERFLVTDNIESFSMDNIALVDEDALEEDLAIDAMVNKARTNYHVGLNYIVTRLDTLCPAVHVSEQSNPVDPRFICEAFRAGAKSLDLEIQSRLVIYKMFERCVIDKLEDVYSEINEDLADKGILPDLHKRKRKIKHQKSRDKKESHHEQDSANEESYERSEFKEDVREEVFNTLRDLLAVRKNYYPDSQQSINTPQLVSALTTLQQDQGYSVTDLKSSVQLKEALKDFLPGDAVRVNGSSIGNMNDDVIDIVSMLFDFVLEDRNVHNDIKALLARLQIPILKVALVDKDFFSKSGHPARKLLNGLASISVGWVPSHRDILDPLIKHITYIVDSVINEFNDDITLFERLLNDFEAFKKTDFKRSTLLEKRVQEAEEGKARTENSRQLVNNEIRRICYQRAIPEAAKFILKEAWAHVLFLESLKKDNQAGWDKAIKVAEFLVWSVQPKASGEERTKLQKIMPSLIKNLRLGMQKISFNSFRTAQLLEELEECHRQILSIHLTPLPDTSLNKELSDKALNDNEGDGVSLEGPSEKEKKHEHLKEKFLSEQDFKMQSFKTQVIDNTIISEELYIKKSANDAQSDNILTLPDELSTITEDDPAYQSVDKLQPGVWLELCTNGHDKERCKLSAFIQANKQFVFVNRSGVKVAEFSRDELASAFSMGYVQLLDDAALFDRALESVITNLRTVHRQETY